MKILANVELTKLREYSRSYGTAETIIVPFVQDYEDDIHLINDVGDCYRIMRKGTKLLISYHGEEITQRSFVIRVNKTIRKRNAEYLERKKLMDAEQKRISIIRDAQLTLWDDLLLKHPMKVAKYKSKVESMPSSKWRNLLKMKAAKHINNGSFVGLEVSPAELKDILYKH